MLVLQGGIQERPTSQRQVSSRSVDEHRKSTGSRRSMSSGGTHSRRMGSIVRKGEEKGMVLPFEPLSMAFSHIYYSVSLPSVRR